MGLSLFSGHCVLAAAWYIVCHFTFLYVYVTNKVLLTCLLKAVSALGPGVLSIGGSCNTKWLFSRLSSTQSRNQLHLVTIHQRYTRTDKRTHNPEDNERQKCGQSTGSATASLLAVLSAPSAASLIRKDSLLTKSMA